MNYATMDTYPTVPAVQAPVRSDLFPTVNSVPHNIRPPPSLPPSSGSVARADPPRPPKPQTAFEDRHFLRGDVDESCRVLANLFTACMLCMFNSPFVVGLKLSLDPDVHYFFGRPFHLFVGPLIWLLPLLILGQWVVNIMMIRSRVKYRIAFLVMPILAAALVIGLGSAYYLHSKYLYWQLQSNDCSNSYLGLVAKRDLQDASDAAAALYQQCLQRVRREEDVVDGRGGREEWIRFQLRYPTLPACEEFISAERSQRYVEPWTGHPIKAGFRSGIRAGKNAVDYHDAWAYLASLELNHACTGFCTAGTVMWTGYERSGRTGGACARHVAMKFLVVKRDGKILMVTGFLVVVLSVFLFIWATPFLKRLGYTASLAGAGI